MQMNDSLICWHRVKIQSSNILTRFWGSASAGPLIQPFNRQHFFVCSQHDPVGAPRW